MARNNRKQGTSGQQPGGFVPASLDSAHSSYSNNHAFAESASGPNHGSASFVQYSRNTVDYSNRRSQGSSKGKIAAVIIVIVLLAAIVGVGVFIYKEMQKQSINQDLHSMSREVMQAIDSELTGTTTFKEPFTMLLLGSDERLGDPEDDIGARTDTIVLVRVDPTQNIISMVSIPRDTMVQLNGVGRAKINAAYSYGGPGGTIAAVKDLCGVSIDHFAQVNFDGMKGLIDSIGGVDVYVEEEVDDPDAGDVYIPAGWQHLDGYQALTFARSRSYADGDFTRVSNQRLIIEAIVHKGLNAPASDLYGIIQTSTEFLTTDSGMDVDFIYSLADQIRHNNDYPVQIFSATIPASTTMVDEISYVVADQAGLDEMMRVFSSGGDVSTVNPQVSADSNAQGEASSAASDSGSAANGGYVSYTDNAGNSATYTYNNNGSSYVEYSSDYADTSYATEGYVEYVDYGNGSASSYDTTYDNSGSAGATTDTGSAAGTGGATGTASVTGAGAANGSGAA